MTKKFKQPKGRSYIEGDEEKEPTMPIVADTLIDEKKSPNSKRESQNNEF